MAKRVLVVDDDPDMRIMLALLLRKSGFLVIAEGADGDEAVELYKQLQPDLVLLDLMMPRVDGITALKLIMKAFPAAQVIVCSGKHNRDTIHEAYAAGARDFIGKPFGRADLQRALDAIYPAPRTVA